MDGFEPTFLIRHVLEDPTSRRRCLSIWVEKGRDVVLTRAGARNRGHTDEALAFRHITRGTRSPYL